MTLVTPFAAAGTCEKEFASAEAFEAEVMDDDKVWAVVFHSAKKGQLVCQLLPSRLPAPASDCHFDCRCGMYCLQILRASPRLRTGS